MLSPTLEVLIVDKEGIPLQLEGNDLLRHGACLTYEAAPDAMKFRETLRRVRPSIIISGTGADGFNARDRLRIVHQDCPDATYYVIGEHPNEPLAQECLLAGAEDFLYPSTFHRLPILIDRALSRRQLQKADRGSTEAPSMQDFTAFMDNLPGGAFIRDSTGAMLYLNEPMKQRYFPDTPDDTILKAASTAIKLITAEDPTHADEFVFTTGRPIRMVQHTTEASGICSWLLAKFPLPQGNHPYPVLGCLGIEVTEQERVLAKLRENEERAKLIFKVTADALWELDLEADAIVWSEAITDTFGFTQESRGNTMQWVIDHVHPEDQEYVVAGFKECIVTGAPTWSAEFRFRKADGTYIDVHDRACIMRHADGTAYRLVGAITDVSARKQWETEMIEARIRAEEIAEMKNNFLSNMNHEIRTPMTAILGFTELLKDTSDGEAREMLEIIESSSKRLLDTLNSIIDLAQLDTDLPQENLVTASIDEEVLAVVERYEPVARGKGIELRCSIEDGPISTAIEIGSLRRVLVNLIGNAIKFTDHGVVEVALRKLGDDFLRVNVIDTGVGISAEHQGRIFEDFKQESEGFSRSFEGCGLGLSISKRLTTRMGGSLEVASTKGKGSIFSVTLPIKSTENRAFPRPLRPSAASKEEIDRLLNQRILVVEDSEDLAMVMQHYLRDVAYVVRVASGEEAVDRASKEQFDLVLLDLHLGAGIDGLEVARRLRLSYPHEQMRIIAMSAYSLNASDRALMEAGCDDYLAKPFSTDELLAMIERVQQLV